MSIQSALNSALAKGLSVTTAISLVVDRSGSMLGYQTNVVDSVTRFIKDQQELKGKAFFTLAQFDDEYDVVFRDREIKEIDASQFRYSPRGGTALRDAFVRAVHDMEDFLKGTSGKDQPKRVVVALVTDGEDTMSKTSVDKVRQIIQEKEKLGWDFMLLGAEGNTLEVAKDLGISEHKTAVYSIDKPEDGIKLLSEKVAQARRGKVVKINQQERVALLGQKEKKDL